MWQSIVERQSWAKQASSHGALKQHSTGFTLLELLVVLAILAMGSALLFPNIGGMGSRTFTAQVREAGALLNYARRTAVVTGQATSVTFYADSEEGDTVSFVASTVTSAATRDESWHARGIALSYRDSTDQRVPVEESVQISFFPEGGSTGGALILSLNAREAVIAIDPFSGKVETEYVDE